MRYISLFSGIEAASVAWAPLGWEPVCFCEIDAFPSAVLACRYPNVPNLGDITKVDWSKVIAEHGAVDVVVGGSPCQSFSVAGRRGGLMDSRGQLMLEYVRAVAEIKPRFFLWENVPGVLSQDGGRAFGTLLGEMDDLGYGMAWRVLDAQFFGVAQTRRRVFLVGCFGEGGAAAAVLFESDSVSGDFETVREKRAELARGSSERAGGAGVGDGVTYCVGSGQANAMISSEVCATLNCAKELPYIIDRAPFNQGANAKYEPHVEKADVMDTLVARGPHAVCSESDGWVARRLTPTEFERLQGFPDGWTLIEWNGKPAEECPDGPRYRALGNSFAVPVVRWIGERLQMVYEILEERGAKDVS